MYTLYSYKINYSYKITIIRNILKVQYYNITLLYTVIYLKFHTINIYQFFIIVDTNLI